MKLGISQFAAALREIRPDEFGPARINPMLESLDLIPSSVERYVKFRPGSYTRNLVYANPEFELMVLCWDAGAVSSIHDHMGQQCWFVAHSGSFQVENYDLLAGGREPGYARVGATTVDSNVTVGMPDYRAPDFNELHRVSVPAGGARAISIHVYAKPLSHCLVFNDREQRCMEKPMAYDNVTIERILVA
ncbi:MAG: cysteine dioxygenase family protein [Candidatus Eremiobacteraeota bacterium]|nr:cysteine dioxygenase family protein [Candidatus Eremiobacteraeota bacterium]